MNYKSARLSFNFNQWNSISKIILLVRYIFTTVKVFLLFRTFMVDYLLRAVLFWGKVIIKMELFILNI